MEKLWSKEAGPVKIKKAVIDNFKGIRHLELNFCDPYSEEPRPLTAILGDNGSGKTSVLQALWIGLTYYNLLAPIAFGESWEGLLLDRVSSLGETQLKLSLVNEDAAEGKGRLLDSTTWIRDGKPINATECHSGNPEELHQQLADVFFFTQNRNIGLFKPQAGTKSYSVDQTWNQGVSALRRTLGDWWLSHVSPESGFKKDYIKEFEDAFSRIFPGTRFLGVLLNPKKVAGWETSPTTDHYFIMEREGKKYDIAEMSSGEQAVFTILFEFVRNDIKKGIILIDELELHLHPPEQQALLAALYKIGPDCQFIITTHSPYIEGVIPDEHEIRLGLEEGRLCL